MEHKSTDEILSEFISSLDKLIENTRMEITLRPLEEVSNSKTSNKKTVVTSATKPYYRMNERW